MNEERRQILEMLAQGKINTDEAERLLSALSTGSAGLSTSASSPGGPRPKAKYLRILVESSESGRPAKVNVRVPMQLLRAGVKLASFLPADARTQVSNSLQEKGVNIDLSKLKPEDIEDLVEQLNDLTVDVDEEGNKVRIFCE